MTSDSKEIFTIGIDIGGTKIDTAIVDVSGKILTSHYRLVHSDKAPEVSISAVIDSVRNCLKESGKKASALGVGVAGQIDTINGIVRHSPNLPTWIDVPLKSILEESLQIPVIINNDVRVITWGEWKHGAGQGIDDLVCLFVGTGVGGGIISHGTVLQGCQNTAGELGHITIVAGGRKCHCPNDGCLEAYAGGWGIAERAQDAVRANPSAGETLIRKAGNISQITSITVSQAYSIGDPLARRIVKDTAKYLSAGIVSIVNAFNPCLIILGGSVMQGIPDLLPMVDKRVREYALQTPVEKLHITMAALGNKAGVIGASALARSLVI